MYVASPPASHMELALLACAAGKPCLVEKPLARTAEESRMIVDAFEKAGVPLFVSYYRRGQPRFLKARELVASGVLGELTDIVYRQSRSDHVSFEQPTSDGSLSNAAKLNSQEGRMSLPWRLRPEIAGGGLVMDVGCHALDVIDYIAGPLQAASGMAWKRGNFPSDARCEDVVHLRCYCGDAKVPVSATWNFASSGPQEEMLVLCGTAGTLRFSCFGTEPMILQHGSGHVEEFSFPHLPHVRAFGLSSFHCLVLQ